MDLIINFFISTIVSFFTFLFLNFRDIISEFSKFKISKKEAFKMKTTRLIILEVILDDMEESLIVGFIVLGLSTMLIFNMMLLIMILFFMLIVWIIRFKIKR